MPKVPRRLTRQEVKDLPEDTPILRLQRSGKAVYLMRGWSTFNFKKEYCGKGGKTPLKGIKKTNAGADFIWIYRCPDGAPLKFPVKDIYLAEDGVPSKTFDEIYNPTKARAQKLQARAEAKARADREALLAQMLNEFNQKINQTVGVA